MSGIYNGPPRGGTRGGRDQFNWETVKADKDRECYLGHSVKAATGRWQQGKDLFWYTRDKTEEGFNLASSAAELDAIKRREDDIMRAALGLPAAAPSSIEDVATNPSADLKMARAGGLDRIDRRRDRSRYDGDLNGYGNEAKERKRSKSHHREPRSRKSRDRERDRYSEKSVGDRSPTTESRKGNTRRESKHRLHSHRSRSRSRNRGISGRRSERMHSVASRNPREEEKYRRDRLHG